MADEDVQRFEMIGEMGVVLAVVTAWKGYKGITVQTEKGVIKGADADALRVIIDTALAWANS